MFTEQQLAAAARCPIARATRWHPHLSRAMQRFGISTRARAAAFIAQLGHESGGLLRVEENLNYSADRLLQVFERHFTVDQARAYARQPARIANRAYANRMGNGDERSGDGYRYRGRGPIQITGADNYRWMGELLGLPLLERPDMLLEPEHGAASAAAYWRGRGLNALADAGDIVGMTKKINGGRTGLADRTDRWNGAKAALGVA